MNPQPSLVRSTDADLWLAPETPRDPGATPRRRLQSLLRGRYHWTILLALTLAAAAALLGYFGPKPQYTGVGQLEIRPTDDTLLYRTSEKEVPPMFNDWLDTQVARFTTAPVIDAAMASDTWTQAAPPNLSENQFLRNLTIERTDGYIISVSFNSPDPRLAAAGANAVMDAFHAYYKDRINQKQSRLISMLETRRNRLENQRHNLRSQKRNLARNLDIESVDQRYQFEVQQVDDLEQQLRQTRLQIAALQVPAAADKANVSIAQLSSTDPHMRSLFQRKEQIQAEMQTELAMGLGENHQNLIRGRLALQHLNQRIQEYARAVRTGQIVPNLGPAGGAALPQLRQRRRQLVELHRQAKANLMKLGRVHDQTQSIDDEIAQTNQQLADTTSELDKRKVESQVNDRVKITTYAAVPHIPSNLHTRRKLAVLGGLGGASLGVGFIALIGLFDRRLRHIDDAHAANLPHRRMLGVLPTVPDNLADPEQAQAAALSVHHVRTLLQIRKNNENNENHNGNGHHTGRVFSITSPAAGSGKSSLAIALGLSFAASRARTLIIDCDIVGAGLTRRLEAVVHPSLSATVRRLDLLADNQIHSIEQKRDPDESFARAAVRLGLLSREQLDHAENQRRRITIGILEACDGLPLDDCIVPAGVGPFHVLPVGAAQPHDAGALSPAALRRLIEKAREKFDTVLIDTGPVLGSIEASIAGVEADGVIFIVSRGDQKTLAHRSLEALEAIDAHIAGIVFNHALAGDIERSFYTSATVSRNRTSAGQRLGQRTIDPAVTDRLGPLGSAVATYGSCASANTGSVAQHA